MGPLIGIPLSVDDRGRWKSTREYHYIDSAYARAIEEAGGTPIYLPLQSDPSTLAITLPSSSNRAPPGYYMLFILNSQGVPSVAHMVQLELDAIFTDGFESGDTSAW